MTTPFRLAKPYDKHHTYDRLVSIGHSCNNALQLQILGIKQETLPFDWVICTPDIILDCVENGFDNYTNFETSLPYKSDVFNINSKCTDDLRRNYYGMRFNHDTEDTDEQLIAKYTRRAERFKAILNSKEKVVFVFSAEVCIFRHDLYTKQAFYHAFIVKFSDTLVRLFPDLNFHIIAINLNISFPDTEKIANINVLWDELTRSTGDFRLIVRALFKGMFMS